MTHPDAAPSDLQVPPVLHLRVTPQVFEVIRRQLGTLPYDQIGGLCQNLEAQVGEQVRAFNTPKVPPAPDQSPANRAARRSKTKLSTKVTPIARAAANAAKVDG